VRSRCLEAALCAVVMGQLVQSFGMKPIRLCAAGIAVHLSLSS
jgi:hypothetical protein